MSPRELSFQSPASRYGISAFEYFNRAIKCKKSATTETPAYWFYCALELRCCIERIIFEYLVLIGSGAVEPKIESLYRPRELKRALLKEEPEFFTKLNFLNVLFEALGVADRVHIPNLEKLNIYYGKFGSYLHAPKRDDKSHEDNAWWQNLYTLTDECIQYIREILSSMRASITLNDFGLHFYNLYKSGIFSKDAVVANMELSNK